MGRLVRDDRKATVTQITILYNQGMQNTISKRTTRRTLKQMGYCSRRPHRVPLLSAKNRKRRQQFAQAHQNWTLGSLVPIEHRSNATVYLSVVADHVHPFMTTVYPSSNGYFQMDNASRHKAQIISDWFLEHDNVHFTQMASTVTRSQSNRVWDVVEREIHIMDM